MRSGEGHGEGSRRRSHEFALALRRGALILLPLGDNGPIVLADKASVCAVMGIKPGISHREIG